MIVACAAAACVTFAGCGAGSSPGHAVSSGAETSSPSPRSSNNPGSQPSRKASSAPPPSSWQSLCEADLGISADSYTSTDENNNEATATWCGYTISLSNSEGYATPGDVDINAVFAVQASQPATFDANDGLFNDLYVGTTGGCDRGGNSCLSLGYDGGTWPMDGYGDISNNQDGIPPVSKSIQLVVISTQMKQQYTAGGQLEIGLCQHPDNCPTFRWTISPAGGQQNGMRIYWGG